jgi:hypothetical protein
MVVDSSIQPKSVLDPGKSSELFITLGVFIHGFGVAARGLTWFSNTLKDGFG